MHLVHLSQSALPFEVIRQIILDPKAIVPMIDPAHLSYQDHGPAGCSHLILNRSDVRPSRQRIAQQGLSLPTDRETVLVRRAHDERHQGGALLEKLRQIEGSGHGNRALGYSPVG